MNHLIPWVVVVVVVIVIDCFIGTCFYVLIQIWGHIQEKYPTLLLYFQLFSCFLCFCSITVVVVVIVV